VFPEATRYWQMSGRMVSSRIGVGASVAWNVGTADVADPIVPGTHGEGAAVMASGVTCGPLQPGKLQPARAAAPVSANTDAIWIRGLLRIPCSRIAPYPGQRKDQSPGPSGHARAV